MKRIIALLFILIVVLSIMATPCYAVGNSIRFDRGRDCLIEKHPVVRLGIDLGFVPFEFINKDGEYVGIAAIYLTLITNQRSRSRYIRYGGSGRIY